MSAFLVSLMVLALLLFALGAVLLLAAIMKAEAERVRAGRGGGPGESAESD